MRIRTVRSLATASFLASGLIVWAGCGENPDGSLTPVGKMEKKAEDGLEKAGETIKKDAKIVGEKIKEGAEVVGEKVKEGVDASGKAIEKAGENLETKGKEAAEKHVGEKAGAVVEGTGKALDKAGEKIQESVKPK